MCTFLRFYSWEQLWRSLFAVGLEHDLDVIVTEQGLADVRGLSPRERAPIIIEKCAHPDYKELLHEVGKRILLILMLNEDSWPYPLFQYYDRSLHECLKRGAGHEPHMLRVRLLFIACTVSEDLLHPHRTPSSSIQTSWSMVRWSSKAGIEFTLRLIFLSRGFKCLVACVYVHIIYEFRTWRMFNAKKQKQKS